VVVVLFVVGEVPADRAAKKELLPPILKLLLVLQGRWQEHKIVFTNSLRGHRLAYIHIRWINVFYLLDRAQQSCDEPRNYAG